jgi:hypothetical protein
MWKFSRVQDQTYRVCAGCGCREVISPVDEEIVSQGRPQSEVSRRREALANAGLTACLVIYSWPFYSPDRPQPERPYPVVISTEIGELLWEKHQRSDWGLPFLPVFPRVGKSHAYRDVVAGQIGRDAHMGTYPWSER